MSFQPKTILNLSAIDYGGAGKFTLHFNDLLRKAGHTSHLVVKDVKTDYPHLIGYPKRFEKPLQKLQRRLAKRHYGEVDTVYDYYFYNLHDRFSTVSARQILALIPTQPDVIIIHWVSDYINAETLHELHQRTGAMIYILMLDNAPITGGCHYPWDCEGYYTDCSGCPAILKPSVQPVARKNLALKKQHLPVNTTLLVFSDNDLKRARQSALFRDKAILKLPGYFVDETKYKPGIQADAKASFGIPQQHRVVFFGATTLHEKRKGMHLLLNALEYVRRDNVTFLVAGTASATDQLDRFMLVGNLTEDQLIKAYQAADMFVCPTLEDSGPTMINQAIFCGTPVVSFDTGIGGDLVYTGKTGYRAKHNDPEDLAFGINSLLDIPSAEFERLRTNCRTLGVAQYGGINTYPDQLLTLLNL